MRHVESDAFLDTSDAPLKFGLGFRVIEREFCRKSSGRPASWRNDGGYRAKCYPLLQGLGPPRHRSIQNQVSDRVPAAPRSGWPPHLSRAPLVPGVANEECRLSPA
jgi:hypothetical protein